MEKVVRFNADVKKIDLSEYEDSEFAVAKLGFISTRPNSHKIDISDKVLKKSAKTALGKWIVADTDAGIRMQHSKEEYIVGIIPKEQEIEFKKDEDGYLRAYANGIISKRYAKDFCNMFSSDDAEKSVSIEAKFSFENEESNKTTGFSIAGITVLGDLISPSCPESNIEIIRFSEAEAEKYYDKIHKESLSTLKKFAEERKEQMQKSEEKDEVMKETRKEEGAMEIEFSAVDIGDIWSKLWTAIDERHEWQYGIYGIYEEDGQKFAILKNKDGLFKVNFTFTEEGLVLADEVTEVKQEFVETDNIKKFAEPENVEEYKFKEIEEKLEEIHGENCECESCKAFKEQIKKLEKTVEDRDAIIMSCNKTIEELQTQNEDLTKFKETVEKQNHVSNVESIMAEIKEFVDEETFAELREEGLNGNKETFDAFANKARAMCFEKVKKAKKDDKGLLTFSMPVEQKKVEGDIWSRLANK